MYSNKYATKHKKNQYNPMKDHAWHGVRRDLVAAISKNPLPITIQELAQKVFVSSEACTRALKELSHEGKLRGIDIGETSVSVADQGGNQ